MNLYQFGIFEVVAKHLNITRASEELHLSQPAVSQQLKLLQETYKVNLYKKSDRGIYLTEDGHEFLGHVKLIIEQLGKLNAHFNGSHRAIRQKPIVVCGSHGLSSEFLPLMLTSFQKKYPQVQIILQTGDNHDIDRKILKGEVDIALMRQPCRSPQIISEPYREDQIVPFVSTDHPVARIGELKLCDLEGTPLIIRGGNKSSTNTEERLKRLKNQGLKLNIAMRCESPKAVKIAVRYKLGLGFLYSEFVKSDVRKGIFKTFKIPDLNLWTTTFILYHRDNPLSANARDFLELLHQRCRKKQPLKVPAQKAENLTM